MLQILTLLLSLAIPFQTTACCFEPAPDEQKGAGTSQQRLQFGRQRPTDEEKERNRQRLGITQLQQQQIDDLYKETGAKMREVRDAMRLKQSELWKAFEDYNYDRGKVRVLQEDIIRLHRKSSAIHAENEDRLRKILTPDQFGKLRALMKEQFDKRREEQRQHGRPPGGPPPG